MKPIKIKIHQLGAIRDSEVEISPVMFFSGESGLGKSYLALLCHYFFEVLLNNTRLTKLFDESEAYQFDRLRKTVTKERQSLPKLKTKDLEQWLAKDIVEYMRYMLQVDDVPCDITLNLPQEINLSFSYQLGDSGLSDKEDRYIFIRLPSLAMQVKDFDIIDRESPFAYTTRFYLRKILFGDISALEDVVILPPSRGAFFTEDITAKTGLFRRFVVRMEDLDTRKEHEPNISRSLLRKYEEIIGGRIVRRDRRYFYETDNLSIPISGTASSVKELAPLSLIISRSDMAKTAILFEEPEAHLHPCMQRKMADLLSMLISHGTYMQITTHSDYILRRLNELIMLGQLKEQYRMEDKEEQFEHKCAELRISPTLALDASGISAYYLEKKNDGTSRVERQSLENGRLSYKSFFRAIEEELRLTSLLEDMVSPPEETSVGSEADCQN
ncbi:AAA family ATPase [Porphyromonas loveana]|uniref:AAA family ATPase n=2 Tax=Porphyromonas loveana TaxID=1884669 RepID=UPI0035A16312